MSKRIEVFEHQTVRAGEPVRAVGGGEARLTEEEIEALVRFNDANGGHFFRVGHQRITTTQYVGYVEVGALCMEILPKADRGGARSQSGRPWRYGLLEMLKVAAGVRLQTPADANQSTDRSSLVELVALRFVDEVERLLRQGLAKGYRDEEANGALFRGRLLVSHHLRENLARADRFFVRYSIYDHSILVNRVLNEALDALGDVTLSSGVSARIHTCRATFPETARLRVTPNVFERLHLGRTTVRYAHALTLARMILEYRMPQLRSGRAPVFALLFDMNLLWERYIAAIFRRAANRDLLISTQESCGFWKPQGQPGRRVRPDVVVRSRSSGEVLLVADTKWKVPPDGVPGDDDLKQMFVYNELFAAPRAVLVYPGVGSSAPCGGSYARREHGCDAVCLGLFECGAWNAKQIQAQVGALLASLRGNPARAMTGNTERIVGIHA